MPLQQKITRVLVIDDNVDGADAVADLLHMLGFAVQRAYSGADGVVQARAMQPDIVVLDLNMPGLDGRETARRIKSAPWAEYVRIIAYSGSASAPLLRCTGSDDLDCIVSKGAPSQVLIDAIRQATVASLADRRG